MITPGTRFGRLVTRSMSGRDKHRQASFECLCDCGNLTVVHSSNLRSGKSKSCGCLNKELTSERALRHGQSCQPGKPATRIYRIWAGMLQRCLNPDNPAYRLYGGRGISVCDRWRTFENFYSDVGHPPTGKSIDRFPNKDGNYEPANWRWATAKEQARNMRTNHLVTIGGKTQCLSAWEEEVGIKHETLRARMRAGWPTVKAITEPVANHG